jgi:hypothetical protein
VVGLKRGVSWGVPAISFERVEGKLVLRRGFTIAKGAGSDGGRHCHNGAFVAGMHCRDWKRGRDAGGCLF